MSVTVTYLEMHSGDELRPKRGSDPAFQVREAKVKQWRVNDALVAWSPRK